MNAGRKPRVAEVLQGIYNSGMEWQRRAIEAEAQVSALTAECDALAQQLQQAQAQLANERAIMNLVPEYVRYLSAWRAGDGRFLVFNEWVTQRVEDVPQAQAIMRTDAYRPQGA